MPAKDLKRVYVVSPLSANSPDLIQDNIERARRLCLLATYEDAAPFAPHAFYTEFLDDTNMDEREIGRMSGLAWLEVCDEVWVWTGRGISGGMREEIAAAKEKGITVIKDPKCWKAVDA